MGSREKSLDADKRRTKAIDKYIENNKRTAVTTMSASAIVDDNIVHLPVYNIRRDMLVLNPNNGRFKAELNIIEEERKKSGQSPELNPDDPEDSKIIQEMIKGEYPPSQDRKGAFNNLLENILEISQNTPSNGQEVPGLITHEGVLVNGNRRWVVMEELSKRKNVKPLKYNTLLVARLPKGVSKYDLWKNEAKEQISQESREEYDYVNSALEIKRGYDLLLEKGVKEKAAKIEIKNTLYGKRVKDVEEYIDFKEFTDMVLDAIGKSGQYTYVQDQGNRKGFVTILRDATKLYKSYRDEMDLPEYDKWFKAICAFCKLAKEKPEVKIGKDKNLKIDLDHRKYRQLQKALDNKQIRKSFLKKPMFKKIDLKALTKDVQIDFYHAWRESTDQYNNEIEKDRPNVLLVKAKDALNTISGTLVGSQKTDQVANMIENNALKHISEIERLLADIKKKIGA